MQTGRSIVAVAGLASNVGKTSLASRLVAALPGWEAIKVTKGHYRSCGKDPAACCVSHLLSEEPLILSGRDPNYAAGKDTARFWDAGASNVHWVIATRQQVADGVRAALARVAPGAPGVIVEGTGFLVDIPADVIVMVARPDSEDIKPSARRVFEMADVLFLSSDGSDASDDVERLRAMLAASGVTCEMPPVMRPADVGRLVELIDRRCSVAR